MSADGLLSSSAQQSSPWDWTTQIRSEFWAIAFSLAAALIVIRSPGRQSLIAAAILAGMAPAVKQTFIAAPGAVFIWLLVSRSFKNAVIWSAAVCVTLLVGFGIAWAREPSMLEHLSALADSAIDYREAFRFLMWALSQPMIPFAAFGVVLALSTRRKDVLLLDVLYCPGSSQRPQFSTRAATSTTLGAAAGVVDTGRVCSSRDRWEGRAAEGGEHADCARFPVGVRVDRGE